MRKLIIKTVAIAAAKNGSKFLSVKGNYAPAEEGQPAMPQDELQFSLPGSKDLIEVCNGVNPLKLSTETGKCLLIRGTEANKADGSVIPGTGLLALNGDRETGTLVEIIDPIGEEPGSFTNEDGEVVPFIKLRFTRGTEEVAI